VGVFGVQNLKSGTFKGPKGPMGIKWPLALVNRIICC